MLVEQTHDIRHEQRQNDKAMRFTDTRLDEQDRGISVKMVPMSLLLPASSGKSFLFNLIDTPGVTAGWLSPVGFGDKRPSCLWVLGTRGYHVLACGLWKVCAASWCLPVFPAWLEVIQEHAAAAPQLGQVLPVCFLGLPGMPHHRFMKDPTVWGQCFW